MRKFVLLCVLLAGIVGAYAENTYRYLVFETTDGAKASVSISSLELSFNGNILTAGSRTFVISNLSKMYFSAVSQESTTGIETIDSYSLCEIMDIYDLKGCRVNKEKLQKGVYIVIIKSGTCKIMVK